MRDRPENTSVTIFARIFSRIISVAVVYAIGSYSLVRAEPLSAAYPPLNPAEMESVLLEIRAMVKTDENGVNDFVVREATPSRIDRLFHMPEMTQLPKTIRENGLIFAGQGTILNYDKPSDIIAKVSIWFPGEVAGVRASKDQRFFGFLHLYGPFETWKDDPVAFLTLWNCMPHIAWVKPGQNPFNPRLNDFLPLLPIAAKSSSTDEYDFGFCVRERSGLRSGKTMEQHRANQAEVRRIADRVTPVLQRKFARFLATNRCQGSGPDDCVLVLHLWASLSPADANLAAALQDLESEVSPDGPLPKMQMRTNGSDRPPEEGDHRFDEALRRAAFMRAKLLSVLNAPAAWPANAKPTTTHQMTTLRKLFADPFVHRWYQYELDYRNDPINPWWVLSQNPELESRMHTAILAELVGLGDDDQCEVFKQWFEHGGKSLETAYVLRRLAENKPPTCGNPNWQWLKQDQSEDARKMRNDYIALLGKVSGEMQDMLLSEFTDSGKTCFASWKPADNNWLHKVCTTWVSEPQDVHFKLEHSNLALSNAEKFHAASLKPSTASEGQQDDGSKHDQEAWLSGLVLDDNEKVKQKLRDITLEFSRRGIWVETATTWSHPLHAKKLIELRVGMVDQPSSRRWPFVGSRLLLVVESQTITIVGVPPRFGYQYDDGEVVSVSDLDKDGNLEVWLQGTFGECDGDNPIPGINCAIETIHMGEVTGDALSYFLLSPGKM